jgi:hypothetical protein
MSRKARTPPKTTEASGDAPRPPAIIAPGPDSREPFDLKSVARSHKEPLLSAPARSEARADRHIKSLEDDKAALQAEVSDLRSREIPDLRSEISRLKDQVALLGNENTRLETSYG